MNGKIVRFELSSGLFSITFSKASIPLSFQNEILAVDVSIYDGNFGNNF